MEKGIIKTLRYFSQFEYAPTFAELWLFHPLPVTEKILKKVVDRLIKRNELLWITTQECQVRYTLGGYSILLNKAAERVPESRNKVNRISPYLTLLKKFGVFSLIGVSGSVAMENAEPAADVDLFIVARAGSIWTARATAIAAASLMGIRRGRTSKNTRDKVCLNMFMDERDLTVPKAKKTEFVAHEILQMKPVFYRGTMYGHFLKANSWIYRFFPNAKDILNIQVRTAGTAHVTPGVTNADGRLRLLESIAKRIQIFFINRHKTTEIVTDTQLWFFPDDFEKKITV